jgi:hypothetical protein
VVPLRHSLGDEHVNDFDIVVEEGAALQFNMANVTRLEQIRDRLLDENFEVSDVIVRACFDVPGILTEEDIAVITEIVREAYDEENAAARFEHMIGDIKAAQRYAGLSEEEYLRYWQAE